MKVGSIHRFGILDYDLESLRILRWLVLVLIAVDKLDNERFPVAVDRPGGVQNGAPVVYDMRLNGGISGSVFHKLEDALSDSSGFRVGFDSNVKLIDITSGYLDWIEIGAQFDGLPCGTPTRASGKNGGVAGSNGHLL